MATITAGYILDRVVKIIQDDTNVRWTIPELLMYLNDGQREVVLIRPDAGSKNIPHPLIPGSTKQALPADGLRLLDIPMNLGYDGLQPGWNIRLVPREQLDNTIPNWHITNPASEIKHYVYDPLNPKVFWVYPRPHPSTPVYVDLHYAAAPSDVDDVDDVIKIDDIYSNCLVDYVLYRAYSKDAEYAQNAQLAAAYLGTFQSSLSSKSQSDTVVNPNSARK